MGALSAIKAAPRALLKAGAKVAFALRKAKPQILVGGGIVVAAGAFVLAIVNARKLDSVMEEGNAKLDELNARKALLEADNSETTDIAVRDQQLKELKKEIDKARQKNIGQILWMLGVPVAGFAGGIMMIVGGHAILLKRFGQVSAALAGLKESYDRYRRRVIAEQGKDADRRYLNGIIGETEVETTVTDENGVEQTVKSVVPIVDPDQRADIYSFEFSENFSRKCPKDPINAISFLRGQEKYWNTWMSSTGNPVTLYMVLNDLGIEVDPDDPMMDYILIAGWRPNGDGDNCIDFGIMRAINKPALDQLSNVIYLNFNCDGNIYHSPRYSKDGRRIPDKVYQPLKRIAN